MVLVIKLLIILSASLSAAADSMQCGLLFYPQGKLGLLENKLHNFPELSMYIKGLLRDPTLPKSTSRLINWFLVTPSIEVKHAQTFQKEHGYELPEGLAFKMIFPQNYRVAERGEFNRMKNKRFRNIQVGDVAPIKTEATIFLKDSLNDSLDKAFAYFIHELAHIRFEYFLDKHIDKYVNSLPASSVKQNDNKYYIAEDVFHYLSERYAYQKEFEITTKTFGTHFLGFKSNIENYRGDVSELVKDLLREESPGIDKNLGNLQFQTMHDIFIKYSRADVLHVNPRLH